MTGTRRNPRRALASLAAALVLTLSACGGDSDADSPLPSAPDTNAGSGGAGSGDQDADLAFARYRECMARFGVDVVVPEEDGVTFEDTVDLADQSSVEPDPEAADEECGALLEQAGMSFDRDPGADAEIADQMLRMQRCLADRGIDVEIQDGGIQIDDVGAGSDIDEALAACDRATRPEMGG